MDINTQVLSTLLQWLEQSTLLTEFVAGKNPSKVLSLLHWPASENPWILLEKAPLKSAKLLSWRVMPPKNYWRYGSAKSRNFTYFCMVTAQTCATWSLYILKYTKFYRAITLLVTETSPSNVASEIILRRSFQQSRVLACPSSQQIKELWTQLLELQGKLCFSL